MAASSSSPSSSLPIHLLLVALSLLSPAMPATFTITNNCEYGVWPGILSGAGTPAPASTGFALRGGESASLEMPASWSGRLWGRTLCSSDPATGRFSCATGDCGTGTIPCSGSGASPPATLAEFTLDGSGGMDFFDVSLVDGYNLPVLVVPRAASSAGKCAATGCAVDVNGICPPELKVTSADEGGRSVACRSACDAFGRAEFCCSGDHASPNTCGPTRFSQFFKSACPRAYSYAYDDGSSTFTCATGTDYLITFCPTIPSQKAGENIPATAGEPLINDTMVFMGATDDTSSVSARARPIVIVAISAISAVLFPAPIHRRFF